MASVPASPALRLVPSGRSLAIGFGLLAAAFGLFFGARETAVFSVHEVQVESVPGGQSRLVDRALEGLDGTSLLRIDQEEIQRRLDKLPHVHLLGYDRAFPNTLRVKVSVERPVAVVRRGDEFFGHSSAGSEDPCPWSGSSARWIHTSAPSSEPRSLRGRSGPSPRFGQRPPVCRRTCGT